MNTKKEKIYYEIKSPNFDHGREEKIYDIIARTSLELGLRTDGKTMATLTKIFAEDLQNDNRLKKLTIEEVSLAFRLGVRYDEKECFLNIRTFYRWCFQHKKRINDAIHEVEYLNKNPLQVEHYPKKLLK